ncbi:hypothetical protein E4U59_002943 [Claviceps monticola]|nr:hypothetical protein E4U59_002943 [Claviceps monticola]
MRGEEISAYTVLDIRASPLITTSIVTVDFEERLGMLEGVNRARNLLSSSVEKQAHLLFTCRALTQYDVPTFSVDRRPCHVAVVWARHGLNNRQDAPPAGRSYGAAETGHWQGIGQYDTIGIRALLQFVDLWSTRTIWHDRQVRALPVLVVRDLGPALPIQIILLLVKFPIRQ